jgi:ubiquinone/menaquinone biosynthesis C-methylase UbiE
MKDNEPNRTSARDLATWDGLAKRYDRIVQRLGARYALISEEMRTDLAGRDRILEIAAGTGLFSETIVRLETKLVATDFSQEMLLLLRQRLGTLLPQNLSIARQDGAALAFADASFDAVVCANALHVIPDPRPVLEEICRVLKPGGLLVAPTFCHGQHWLARLISRLMSAFSTFRAYSRFSEKSLCGAVERAGFQVSRTVNTGGVLPIVYLAATR